MTSTQSSEQQAQPLLLREAPGGEILSSKLGAESAPPASISSSSFDQPLVGQAQTQGQGQGLGQGLTKSQAKKLRKQQFKQQNKDKDQQQSQQGQHYVEKRTATAESSQLSQPSQPTLAEEQLIPKEGGIATSGISKESAMTQAQTQTPPQQQMMPPSPRQQDYQPSPVTAAKEWQSGQQQQQAISGDTTSVGGMPPLLSPEEEQRQYQARKEVERLEEQERSERIAREKAEDMKERARSEANLIGTIREEEAERQRRIAEDEMLEDRTDASEASLIGTIIDEETERRRRIAEDYETYSEPLSKAKALEEIERTRRIHSKAERGRQELAAKSSRLLFPQYSQPSFNVEKLWNATGSIKREAPTVKSSATSRIRATETRGGVGGVGGVGSRGVGGQRYGQFIATTTASTTEHLPGHAHVRVVEKPVATKVGQASAMPSTSAELTVTESEISSSAYPMSSIKTITTSSVTGSGQTKISKETYQASTRPRLVVHHSGLSGKWQRATETVQLHEGIDY